MSDSIEELGTGEVRCRSHEREHVLHHREIVEVRRCYSAHRSYIVTRRGLPNIVLGVPVERVRPVLDAARRNDLQLSLDFENTKADQVRADRPSQSSTT
jgi:hypothetical protein